MKLLKTLLVLHMISASLPLAHGNVTEFLMFSSLGRRAEFANVSLPAVPTTSDEVEVSLVLGLPYGCYRPDVGIEHRDEFTHVLKPILLDDANRCSRPTSLDFQKLSLGYLRMGEHRVIVENLEQTFEPRTFWVGEANP